MARWGTSGRFRMKLKEKKVWAKRVMAKAGSVRTTLLNHPRLFHTNKHHGKKQTRYQRPTEAADYTSASPKSSWLTSTNSQVIHRKYHFSQSRSKQVHQHHEQACHHRRSSSSRNYENQFVRSTGIDVNPTMNASNFRRKLIYSPEYRTSPLVMASSQSFRRRPEKIPHRILGLGCRLVHPVATRRSRSEPSNTPSTLSRLSQKTRFIVPTRHLHSSSPNNFDRYDPHSVKARRDSRDNPTHLCADRIYRACSLSYQHRMEHCPVGEYPITRQSDDNLIPFFRDYHTPYGTFGSQYQQGRGQEQEQFPIGGCGMIRQRQGDGDHTTLCQSLHDESYTHIPQHEHLFFHQEEFESNRLRSNSKSLTQKFDGADDGFGSNWGDQRPESLFLRSSPNLSTLSFKCDHRPFYSSFCERPLQPSTDNWCDDKQQEKKKDIPSWQSDSPMEPPPPPFGLSEDNRYCDQLPQMDFPLCNNIRSDNLQSRSCEDDQCYQDPQHDCYPSWNEQTSITSLVLYGQGDHVDNYVNKHGDPYLDDNVSVTINTSPTGDDFGFDFEHESIGSRASIKNTSYFEDDISDLSTSYKELDP